VTPVKNMITYVADSVTVFSDDVSLDIFSSGFPDGKQLVRMLSITSACHSQKHAWFLAVHQLPSLVPPTCSENLVLMCRTVCPIDSARGASDSSFLHQRLSILINKFQYDERRFFFSNTGRSAHTSIHCYR
jgi:hypothetical protein